ncbi:hypothetical protein GCM10020331_004470 [Ectobacillus funiculus]
MLCYIYFTKLKWGITIDLGKGMNPFNVNKFYYKEIEECLKKYFTSFSNVRVTSLNIGRIHRNHDGDSASRFATAN